jgi:hypothetical protein
MPILSRYSSLLAATECRNAECYNNEFRYARCRYAECHGALHEPLVSIP